MGMNIQHSTFKAQLPVAAHGRPPLGGWRLNVKCSVLVFFFALPLYAQTDTNALPNLAPAYGELRPTFWEQHQTVIIIAGFALLAIVLLSLQVMLRPKTVLVLPPEAIARRALKKMSGRPEDGKMLSEISQILRHYLGAAFELPAAEMNTAEFSAILSTNEKIGMAFAQTVSDFLRVCDKDKFSPKTVAPPLNAVNRALELIEMAEKRRDRPGGGQK